MHAKPNMCVLATALEMFRRVLLVLRCVGATADVAARSLGSVPRDDNHRSDAVLALHSH